MRVLYLANYQGRVALAQRRFVRNRALGASTKIEAISRALAIRGHDVTVLSMATPAERSARIYGVQREEIRAGNGVVRVVYLPAIDVPVLNVWSGRAAVAGYLWRRPAWDVALVYNLAPDAVAAARQLRRSGVPIVFEYEDDACATLEKGPGGNPRGAKAVNEARRLASGVIAVSDELALQFAAPRSMVARGAVPDTAFDIPARRFGVGSEPLRVLYAGGLTRPKGVDLLLEAIHLVRGGVELTIVGAGPLEETVRRAAASSKCVIFEGEVSRSRLEELLSRAHVCINPHRTGAGQKDTLFPFKLSEYLAFGAIVVSSQLGTTPRAVERAIRSYAGDDPRSIAEAIDDVLGRYSEFAAKVEDARRALRAEVSESALGALIESLLKGAIRG